MKLSRVQITWITVTMAAMPWVASGCASMKNVFAIGTPAGAPGPIHNPFGDYDPAKRDASQNVVLRTKKGDRSVEVELPADTAQMTDFTIPVSPAFNDSGSRGPASVGSSFDPDQYRAKPPSMADREITRAFPSAGVDHENSRRDVEQGLGLMPSENDQPEADQSYLGALDHLKALYRAGRYEAGLLETDALLKQYPTAPRIYQMRGTLLERVGQSELALKAWKQALILEPGNQTLRKFVERREQKRSLASP